MKLVDRGTHRPPVLPDSPGPSWQPTQHPAAHAPSAPAAPPRGPRSVVVALAAREAVDLPSRLPELLARHDVQPGDRVTVDLADVGSVHIPGLELLLTVLWRRVGVHGEVLLVGGTRGLLAQLRSLDVSPQRCRAAVYGPWHAPVVGPAPLAGPVQAIPAPRPPALVPQQRGRHDPIERPDSASVVQLAWSGDVDVTADARTRAQLDDLLRERGTRGMAIDLSNVTYLSLGTLRALLDADRRLRSRGGRLQLLHPRPPVMRLLAVTHTTHLADEGPHAASSIAGLPVS